MRRETPVLTLPGWQCLAEPLTPKALDPTDPDDPAKVIYSKVLRNEVLDAIDAALSGQQRRVIKLRYEHDMTLDQIGDRFGLDRARIRQIERAALRAARRVLKGLGIGPGDF
ncbi:MAG: sigma-70 family RNA polymerase sigma factor [Acidobacteriaceae bacterium]